MRTITIYKPASCGKTEALPFILLWGRCETCRHWEAPLASGSDPEGLCKAEDNRFRGGGDLSHLFTTRDFGCLAHETAAPLLIA